MSRPCKHGHDPACYAAVTCALCAARQEMCDRVRALQAELRAIRADLARGIIYMTPAQTCAAAALPPRFRQPRTTNDDCRRESNTRSGSGRYGLVAR